MYKQFLKLMFGLTLLVSCWPVLRIADIVLFDWLTPLCLVCAFPLPTPKDAPKINYRLPVIALVLFVFAGMISILATSNVNEHLIKFVKLLIALTMMLSFSYTLVRKKIFSFETVQALLVLSGTICALICVIQGQFGILTGIIPATEGEVHDWTRMTGLAEHPIETGVITAYTMVMAMNFVLQGKRPVLYALALLICLYSERYSASLTATFSLVLALGILCVVWKAYTKLILLGMIGVVTLAALLMFDEKGLLTQRLTVFSSSGGNYETLQSREDQWHKAIEQITPMTVLMGNGYSISDLPNGLEIHNGLIASIFHFGITALVSQLLFLYYLFSRWRTPSPLALRAALASCCIIFIAAYMTGPPFSRRTLWVPMFAMAAFASVAAKDQEKRTLIKTVAPSFKG